MELELAARKRRGRRPGSGPPAAVVVADDVVELEQSDGHNNIEFANHDASVVVPRRKGQQPRNLVHQVYSLSLAMLLRNAGKIPEVVQRAFTLATPFAISDCSFSSGHWWMSGMSCFELHCFTSFQNPTRPPQVSYVAVVVVVFFDRVVRLGPEDHFVTVCECVCLFNSFDAMQGFWL